MGDSGGKVNLQLVSECDTLSAEPFIVSTVTSPSDENFILHFFDDQNDILWQAVPGSSNQIELSETSNLSVDYIIDEPGENPSVFFEFQNPVDLTSHNEFEIVLKTTAPAPGSFRVDLIDVNGIVNQDDLFRSNFLKPMVNFTALPISLVKTRMEFTPFQKFNP